MCRFCRQELTPVFPIAWDTPIRLPLNCTCAVMAKGFSNSSQQKSPSVWDTPNRSHSNCSCASWGKSHNSRSVISEVAFISNLAVMEVQLKNFWEHGYATFTGLVNASVVKHALDAVPKLQYTSIYRKVTGEYDEHIMQASLSAPLNPAFTSINVAITNGILKKAPLMRWEAARWVALKNLAGGDEEEAHQSFSTPEIERARAEFDTIQVIIGVGLTPDTKFVVHDRCFIQSDLSKRRVLEFGPGDCVLIRGDLVHANAAFRETNYLMHLAVTVKGRILECECVWSDPPRDI
uniref:AlNc14C33G3000 protein n=1 Tax=Albugo laibachii Nc14 TaxID=890382 RepID=F0W8A6_9STRA|nr:AlNc14C33G3000 [Albugo laibachii Nc14]|eukprot:CCA17306.1 AlNc14C33G3000 [Albugo laibachii Nc14]